MMIMLTLTEGNKSERKVTVSDSSSVPTSRPTTVNVQSENDVSIQSKVKEEVEEWPIREMIAILGRNFIYNY